MKSGEPGAGGAHALRIALAVTVVVVFGYLLASAGEPIRLNWGDPWSDANVLTALNYSSKYGFIATSFTDVLDVGPLTDESYRYTHYPPFAEILYGCVRKLAGGAPLDITVYRVLAIGFSAIGLHALFRWVSGVWGRAVATWATVFCATNLLWLQFADSMHQSPILFASGMIVLAGVVARVNGSAPRRALVAITVGTYVCFLTAYDYYFFLPIVTLLTARVLGVPLVGRRMFALAALVAASGALAIATKAAFVTGALGWKGFLEDVHFQFLERATTKFSPDYRSGFLIILLLRWTSYFTPLAFLAAGLSLASVARGVRRLGPREAVRRLLFGSDDLTAHAGSLAILLAGGLPFILVFSELSVEQVLPSQVMLPFVVVGTGWLAAKGARRARGRAPWVLLAGVLVWQGAHLVRIPKAFLPREIAAQIRDYLRQNDGNDFVITNIMDDGIVQYFFERHLLPPTPIVEHAPGGYREIAARTPSGVMHAVHFEDPNGRLVDKGLWSLLPYKSLWAVFGTPYVLRDKALREIADYDAHVLEGLERSGREVLRLPGVRVFRIGADLPTRRAAGRAQLTEPVRLLDFGRPEVEAYKIAGFRHPENYPGVPGFCWTVTRTPQRTVLTKRGLSFKPVLPVLNESLLLLRFEQKQDERVSLLTWAAIDGQTLSASIDGTTVLTHQFGPMQTRQELSFVVPRALQQGDPVKEVAFRFRDVADYGGAVAFAILRIEPATPEE